MPYEGERGAFWALLGPDVEFRHTEYDVEAAVAPSEALGAPVDEQLLELSARAARSGRDDRSTSRSSVRA